MKGLMKASDGGSVGRPRKRCINTVKECLRKRCLDVRQARRMGNDRKVRGVCEGELLLLLLGLPRGGQHSRLYITTEVKSI